MDGDIQERLRLVVLHRNVAECDTKRFGAGVELPEKTAL